MIYCSKCNQDLPKGQFYVLKSGRIITPCRSCKTAASLEWAKKNPERRRANWQRSQGNNLDRHREQSREYSKRHPERRRASTEKWRSRNPEKYAAHRAVQIEIIMGRMEKRPCELCGEKNSHAHHPDYSQPLMVRWLCPAHHKQEHAQ